MSNKVGRAPRITSVPTPEARPQAPRRAGKAGTLGLMAAVALGAGYVWVSHSADSQPPCGSRIVEAGAGDTPTTVAYKANRRGLNDAQLNIVLTIIGGEIQVGEVQVPLMGDNCQDNQDGGVLPPLQTSQAK